MALINLFTKKTATIAGLSFTLVFFAIFYFSERAYADEQEANQIHGNPYPDDPFRERTRERFRFEVREHLSGSTAGVAPCSDLLSLERTTDLHSLDRVLQKRQADSAPLVVAVVADLNYKRIEAKPDDPASVPGKVNDFFSEAVFSAEAVGSPLKLIALNGEHVDEVLPAAAARLKANLKPRTRLS